MHWGESAELITGRNVTLTFEKENGGLRLFSAAKLRRLPEETGVVRIVISKDSGLQRIVWTSKDITDDKFGKKGIEEYLKFKSKLTDDFGRPRFSSEEIGIIRFTEADQFYECISLDGCGAYISKWRTDEGDVTMRLISNNQADRGQVEITFDGPEWDALVARRDKPAGEKPKAGPSGRESR
ncbi:MAG TPA: hypothetical protein HPP80_07450 [Rhodospirillaceae bacterium]|nr:hypothetical protein [Rhodospirillaceae bacterium]